MYQMVNLNIPIEEGVFPYTLLKYQVKLVIFKVKSGSFLPHTQVWM